MDVVINASAQIGHSELQVIFFSNGTFGPSRPDAVQQRIECPVLYMLHANPHLLHFPHLHILQFENTTPAMSVITS